MKFGSHTLMVVYPTKVTKYIMVKEAQSFPQGSLTEKDSKFMKNAITPSVGIEPTTTWLKATRSTG